jgi:UDP-glucose 4-epimerase
MARSSDRRPARAPAQASARDTAGSTGPIVVTGASGNVGTGVLRRLAADLPDVPVVAVCRRVPPAVPPYDGVRWLAVDLSSDLARPRLEQAFRGASAVVHLAWAIQPVRAANRMRRTNVDGTATVLRAARAAGVRHLIHASSLGAYAPGAPAPVDETWPDSGQRTSAYSVQKVLVERMLDHFERENPDIGVARIRPTLVVQRLAASEIKGLFLGPLVVRPALEALRRGLLPVFPLPAGLALQFVHADDVGDAVVRILERRSTGVFNLAADALDVRQLADIVGARPLEVSPDGMRAVVQVLFALHALAASPGWFDVATRTPLMDTARARDELGWTPRHSSTECGRELLDALADGVVGASAALGG